jgi:hypothetical protein
VSPPKHSPPPEQNVMMAEFVPSSNLFYKFAWIGIHKPACNFPPVACAQKCLQILSSFFFGRF